MNLGQLPSIWFLYGDYWMEMRPDQYTMPVTDDKCSFCLIESYNDNSGWKLGTGFLKDWYVVHSVGEDKIGFAPHVDSWRQAPE